MHNNLVFTTTIKGAIFDKFYFCYEAKILTLIPLTLTSTMQIPWEASPKHENKNN